MLESDFTRKSLSRAHYSLRKGNTAVSLKMSSESTALLAENKSGEEEKNCAYVSLMAFSIFTLIACFWPLGALGIQYTRKVSDLNFYIFEDYTFSLSVTNSTNHHSLFFLLLQ